MQCSCASASQNLIFRFLQSKQRIQIWLYENTDTRIEGRIIVRPAAASGRKQAANKHTDKLLLRRFAGVR